MAHLFGISDTYPVVVASTSIVLSGQYAYRRSDDYYVAFFDSFSPFLDYFGPGSGTGEPFGFAEVENTNENGTAKTVSPEYINSQNRVFGHHALITGDIAQGDERVSLSISTTVTTADFLPAVPTNRWESSGLLAKSGPQTTWQFKLPLPLTFGLFFDGSTYTVRGAVTRSFVDSNGVPFPTGTDTNGRFIHIPYSYAPGAIGAMCAVHGTQFHYLEEEIAHNSLSFQLAGGAMSRTFETVDSALSFPASTTGGQLPFSSNSEAVGAQSGRAFFPAIVRASAQLIEAGRVRVDCSGTVSPTANIVGIYVENGSRGVGNPTLTQHVDHYEVNGEIVTGPLIPSMVFDMVFKEEDAAFSGYATLWAVVDAPAFPPSGDTLALNYEMSRPALLFVSAQTQDTSVQTQAIVRPYGELKSRAGSQLWQHKTNPHDIYAGEVGTGKGNVYRSSDEGETWDLMANAWTGVSGAKPLGFTGLPFKRAISIAKVGANIQSRFSPDQGKTWDAPVTVCPYTTTGSWSIASHEYSGRDDITVTNQIDKEFVSTDDGTTWSAAT